MKKHPEKLLLKVPARLIDKRLDSVLATLLGEKFPDQEILSRTALTELIRAGLVTVNGKWGKPHYLVRLGDTLELPLSSLTRPKIREFSDRTRLSLSVLFENDDFLVIDKPAGLLVHPTVRSQEETAAHWLVATRPAVKGIGEDPTRPGLVHRLDKDTSGLLIVAKTNKTFQAVKALFQGKKIQKTYWALVYGHVSPPQGVINAPLTHRSGALKRSVAHATEKSREAVTEYRTLEQYGGYDLLEVSPKTGRTHQIRVHLAHLGHPVVGDPLYSFRPHRRLRDPLADRQLLHAARLSFELFGQKYDFEAPLPPDFRKALQKIGPVISA